MKKLFLLGVLVILPAIAISTAALLAANQKHDKSKPPISRADLIANMKSALIQISYKSDLPIPNAVGLPAAGPAGTGFFANRDGYALTAAHVIIATKKMLVANGARDVRFFAGISLDSTSIPGGVTYLGVFLPISCTIVDMDEAHDIAILKLDQNPFSPTFRSASEVQLRIQTARLQSELPPEETELLVSGYPLLVSRLVTQRGTVASLSFQVVRANLPDAPRWLNFPEVADQILVDIVVNPGDSGGPFYLSDTGKVIGICHGNLQSFVRLEDGSNAILQQGGVTHALMQNSGLAIVLPIKYAIALLDKNKITYEH